MNIKNIKDFERRLSPMEIEEISTRTKASSVEEKKVMVSVMPTDILEAELNRRNHITDTMIDYIWRFSDYISTIEDSSEREREISKFRKVIAKGGVVNAVSF